MTNPARKNPLPDGGSESLRAADQTGALRRPYLVWAVASVAVTMTFTGLALVHVNRRVPEAAFRDFAIPEVVTALLLTPIGAWIAIRRPRNAMGWLMLIVGTGAAVSFFTTQYAAAGLVSRPDWNLPLAGAAAVIAQIAFIVPNVIERGLILYAFPDGRLDRRAGRVVVFLSGLAVLGFTLAALAVPYPWYESRPDVTAPLAPALSAYSSTFYEWFGRAFAPVTALCTFALIRRLLHSTAPQRGPLVLFTGAALVSFVQLAVVQAVFPDFSEPIWLDAGLATLGTIAIAVATVLSVVRYRLWELDVILRRSFVFAGLTLCLAAGYLGLVAGASAIFSEDRLAPSLAAAVVVAAVATPLRAWLQRGVDRLLFGDRHDPDKAMAKLGRRLGTIEDVDALLAEVAASMATSLRVPYVGLSVMGEGGLAPAAEWGHPSSGTETIPLSAHGELVGSLDIGRREPNLALEGADRRLLDDLGRQAALAVAVVRRSHELQASRQRLVGAREEERRRMRRDLHDGLGPALAATTLQLDEAADLIEGDPESARRLLRTLRTNAQEMINDVRRLVYELRPPALDELGLVGALRQYADNLSTGHTVFEVDSEAEHPELPAAVEVALWRIATEAMTNVVRHADARHCCVRLQVTDGDSVELEVADDGRGIKSARPGVGLTSIRERAAELGGEWTVAARQEGGTRVRVVLPVRRP